MPGVIIKPLAGCIMWLPPKQDLVPIDEDIEDGCCNHPVVVLSTAPRAAKVDILIITSFGGLDLEVKHPNHSLARLDHLPIAPCKAHPDNGKLLFLKDPSYEMRKRSYVKTKSRRRILLASLQPYNRHGPEVFLSKRSYTVLVKHIQYSESFETPSIETPRNEHKHLNSPRQQIEPSISIERSGPSEDLVLLWQQARAAIDRQSRAVSTIHVPSNYYNVSSSRNTTLSDERQPLLCSYTHREDRRSRPYAGRIYAAHPVLPTTHPIREEYGSDASQPFDWEKFWGCVGTILSICLLLLLSYGLYLGGCWAVAACGRMLDGMKPLFQVCYEEVQSCWASLLKFLGY